LTSKADAVESAGQRAALLQTELDHAGREFLIALVECRNPAAVADRWARDKSQHPFFTTFVMNMLYIAHNAMTKPSAPIRPCITSPSQQFFNRDRQIANPLPGRVIDRIRDRRRYRNCSQLAEAL